MSAARGVSELASSLVGMVTTFPHANIPSGFLECDGASLSTTTYADLFAVIGYTYGGSGASFNVPDYRGEFLRGWANTSANDPDRASRTDRGDGVTGDNVGTKQTGEVQSHSHDAPTQQEGTGGPSFCPGSSTARADVTTRVSGGNETRGRNVNVLYCIKY